MKSTRAPSLLLALVLQVMPVTRVILATPPVGGTSFAIVSTWIAGLAALLGSYNAVSGASTTITSAGTATGTNGTAFSYRITTGPDTANTFSAVPLPAGLACNTGTGRITGTPTQEGSFSVLLTASDSGKPSRTVTKTLALTVQAASNPNTPPGITSQPSSQTVIAGGTASFTVTATGSAPLRYQWRTNGIAMTGATNSTLTISGATPSQAGNYAVVITNSSGSITSATAILTVLIPPSITTQPVSQSVSAGNSAGFTVAATGTAPLGYRWRKNGTFINGANSTTLSLPSAGAGDAGSYTVVVTNSAGSVTSSVAVLTVNAPPGITTQPVSQSAFLGANATLSVVAAGTGPLAYQWRLAGTNLVNATNTDLLLTALTTNHAGSYSVVITNSLGSVTSNPAILTVVPAPVAPTITAQPEDVTVTIGSNATFSVTADGDAPLQYQWRRNASNLPGETQATLNLVGVQLANAGGYSVVVSNSAGAVTSVVATLTVNQAPVPDTQVPTVRIVTPGAAFARVVSSALQLSGTAQDNQRVASVDVRLGSDAFAAAGTTNWTADLSLTPGTNIIQVCAIDVAGNRSPTNTLTVFFAVMTPLSLTTTGNGTVAALTNNQLLELGQSYSLQATPASGNIFSNWLVGDQIATGPRLTFVMSSNLAVEAHFVPNPWSAQKGVYTGLFHPTNEPVHEQSGFFSLVTTDKGTYSGKLLLNGATYPFTGTVGLDLGSDTLIARRGTNSLQLHLQFESGSDHVAGSLSDTLWTSELFGYRALFNAKTNPATSFQGKYTLLLPGLDQTEVSPAGAGYASIVVSSSGSVALKGGLADGTTGVAKGALAANGQLPVFLNLYGGRGSAFGWLTFANTETNDILGRLLWTKPPPVTVGTLHPAGFTNEIVALGSRFTTPAPGTAVAGFSNAVVILEGGNLTSPVTNDVFLSSQNKITVSTNQTIRLALAVSPSSGLLIGRFVHPETSTPSLFKGVVLQKQDLAGGYFLGTTRGGRVYLGRPEDATVLVPQP